MLPLAQRRANLRAYRRDLHNHEVNAPKPRKRKRPHKFRFRIKGCPNPFAVRNILFQELYSLA